MSVALAKLVTAVRGVMLALPVAIPITSLALRQLQHVRAVTLIIVVNRQVARTMLGTSTCANRLGIIGRKALQFLVCIKTFSTLALG